MVNAPTLTANADDARVFSAHGAWNVANGEVLERLREQPKAADAAVKTRRGLAASPALSIVERGPGRFEGRKLGILVTEGRCGRTVDLQRLGAGRTVAGIP